VNNEYISDTYKQVLKEVYPEVKTLQRGLLHRVIEIILGEEEFQAQENLEIYSRLGVKSNARREEDHMVIDNLVEVIEDKHPLVWDAPAKFFREWMEKIKNQPTEKIEIEWIIIGACIFVGLYACIMFLNKKNQRRGKKLTPHSPIPAELCLVVPAKAASTLKVGSDLSTSDVSKLIDNATYFLCIMSNEADLKEQCLELVRDASILPDSQREVYVRVSVSDGGRNLIDQAIPYTLKTNLPATAKFTIKQLACLGTLSGLEVFKRI